MVIAVTLDNIVMIILSVVVPIFVRSKLGFIFIFGCFCSTYIDIFREVTVDALLCAI